MALNVTGDCKGMVVLQGRAVHLHCDTRRQITQQKFAFVLRTATVHPPSGPKHHLHIASGSVALTAHRAEQVPERQLRPRGPHLQPCLGTVQVTHVVLRAGQLDGRARGKAGQAQRAQRVIRRRSSGGFAGWRRAGCWAGEAGRAVRLSTHPDAPMAARQATRAGADQLAPAGCGATHPALPALQQRLQLRLLYAVAELHPQGPELRFQCQCSRRRMAGAAG